MEGNLGLVATRESATRIESSGAVYLDLTASRWRTDVGRGGLVTAASFGVQGGGASDAVCRSDGEGGCLPGPPELLSLSTLAGWQSAGEMIRVMAGPTLAIADGESAGLGVTSRLDLHVPVSSRVQLSLGARGSRFPTIRGNRLTVFGVGGGLRIRLP